MKIKALIGIVVAGIGIAGIVAFAIHHSIFLGIGGGLLTVVGVIISFVFKGKRDAPQVVAEDSLFKGQELDVEKIPELLHMLIEKALTDKDASATAAKFVGPDETPEVAAEKYLFMARLNIAYSHFKEAEEFYKKAVEIFPSYENVSSAADFYYSLNKFEEAKECCKRCLKMAIPPEERASVLNNLGLIIEDNLEAEKTFVEALGIYRKLADKKPNAYMPDIANILNNLGVLQEKKGEYEQAKVYYNEALIIRKKLAQQDPETYKPILARILNNLGNLHINLEDYEKAEECHKKALQLYRDLAAKDLRTYTPDLAVVLRNLGTVYVEKSEKDYEKAEQCYTESLTLFRKLARKNPQAYNPDVAMSIGSLGDLFADKAEPDHAKAEAAYAESLNTYRLLAEEQPHAWNPYVARMLVSMAVFYQDNVPNKALSMKYAKEAIEILKGCDEGSVMVREARNFAYIILEDLEKN